MRRVERENTGDMHPGQDLVVVGYAGLAGTIQAVCKKRQDLEAWFSKDYLEQILSCEEAEETRDLEYYKAFGATECQEATEGGILKALWDLSGAYEMGIEFALRKIPVKQSTIEICERLEWNPYRLYSKGCFLLTADHGGHMIKALAQNQIPAAVIGVVSNGIARVMIHGEGRGFLERPQPDELNKLS